MKYTHEEVISGVRSAIAGSLRVAPEAVTMDLVLADEFGATSLDFVDIIFRLQSVFKVTFYEGDILEKLSEVFGTDTLSFNRYLTALGVDILRQRMPEIDPSRIYANMPAAAVRSLSTPATWVRAVKEMLEARPRSCSSCGSESLTPIRPSLLICETCRQEIRCPTQEEVLLAWAQDISTSLKDA